MYDSLLIAQSGGGGSLIGALAMPLMLLVLMYFLFIRPQQVQMREAKKFRDALKAGDRVITSGGLLGRILEVDPEVITLEVAPKVKIRIIRSQIVRYQPEGASAESPVETEAK